MHNHDNNLSLQTVSLAIFTSNSYISEFYILHFYSYYFRVLMVKFFFLEV